MKYEQNKRKTTAQIAHLVFCRHAKYQPEKIKRAIFYQLTKLIILLRFY